MGTNYEWRETLCAHCGNTMTVHVGKSSGGWTFLFRAWPHSAEDWGSKSPFGQAVGSRADWRQIFTTRTGQLWDEYGRQTQDPAAWIDALDAPTPEQMEKEQLWRGGWSAGTIRRDREGFRVEAGEFS